MDVWSRRIVGWEVHDDERAERAATLIHRICAESGVDPNGLVLHSDNGKPMRGNTMIATLQWLGIVPSFSRPHVCNYNPYSEALFRTLKHTPGSRTAGYPAKSSNQFSRIRNPLGRRRRSLANCPDRWLPAEPEAPSVPSDDLLKLHDDERRSPSGPNAGESHPEPTVRFREPQPPRPRALQHLQLVPQGQHFELERGARTRPCSEGQEERGEHRRHRPEAYPSSAATSTDATRTDVSAATARLERNSPSGAIGHASRGAKSDECSPL
jgi:hypothetical protein